jgi:hypothetical protein
MRSLAIGARRTGPGSGYVQRARSNAYAQSASVGGQTGPMNGSCGGASRSGLMSTHDSEIDRGFGAWCRQAVHPPASASAASDAPSRARRRRRAAAARRSLSVS